MNTPTPSPATQPPSVRTLITTIAVAIVAAGLILVTTVLPAEYGIDLVGVGRVLGLTAIASSTPADDVIEMPSGTGLIPRQIGPVGHFATDFKMDSVQLVLDPYQYVEYKYRLEQGATMLYAWTASSMPLYDFHADPDGDPKPDPVSFDNESKSRASGAFTAPFSGIHGWYWENPGGTPLTISLTTAGFYSAATEFRSPRMRRAHPLTEIEQLVFSAPSRDPAPSR